MKFNIPEQKTPSADATPSHPRKLKKVLSALPNSNMGELTKQTYMPLSVNEIETTIHEAMYVASTGRGGPVVVDIPKDVQLQETDSVCDLILAPASRSCRAFSIHRRWIWTS